ncbi:HAD family hydrolase [Dyadobacter luteus]|jgi:HAD superfamily hydrolase (TIGR01549 family)|uniref:HAD family hydrolase n=1 Tax=Dyadobacter luteus TaxID=2259619 RepID=A0A3D8YF58_9BACT|nr:HAD family hydrolase [Dyadobacter luteus]REA63269.1 HAD family hydrolase [Dyadobacter luteus]
MIKGVLIDYGGTIDTNGLHWGSVLWSAYQKFESGITKEEFSKAYSFGERSLAINPIIKPSHSFYDTLELKVEQQFQFLKDNGSELPAELIKAIAKECNDFALETVRKAKPVLQELASQYPVILVSNFYGNINRVLEVFEIESFFQEIVESAVVKVRKPDPKIYQLGVEALGLKPEECVVIGDSFTKDIVPAKTIGCKAIWINVAGWEDTTVNHEGPYQADAEIKDFSQVPGIINQLNK